MGLVSNRFFFFPRKRIQPANHWPTILSSTHGQRTNFIKTGQVIAEKQTLNAPHLRKINEVPVLKLIVAGRRRDKYGVS